MKKQPVVALAITLVLLSCNDPYTTDLADTTGTTISQPDSGNAGIVEIAEETVVVPGDLYASSPGQQIHVRYFEKDGKRVAGLLKNEDPEKILYQVEGSAFAKGADYEGEHIKWQAKGNEGTWIENGKSEKYKLVSK